MIFVNGIVCAPCARSARGPLRLRPQRRPLADGGRPPEQARPAAASTSAPPARTRPTRSTRRRSRRWPRSASTSPRSSRSRSRDEAVRAADVVITMGCGDACPIYPGQALRGLGARGPGGQGPRDRAPDPRRDRGARAGAARRARSPDAEPPDLGAAGRGRGPRHLRPGLRRLRRDRRRLGLRRRARRGRRRPGLRAGHHGHGLRHRPPLRRPHQPGRDARLHADPPLPSPRGRRLHRRPAGRSRRRRAGPARGLARPAGRARRHGPERRRRQRPGLRARS